MASTIVISAMVFHVTCDCLKMTCLYKELDVVDSKIDEIKSIHK